MKKSGLFIANIVLGCVFGVFLIISICVVFIMKGSFAIVESAYEEFDWYDELYGSLPDNYYDDYYSDYYSDYEREVYELPVIKSASATLIGSEFQDKTAYEGYQFYTVKVTVYNGGTDYIIPYYLSLYCAGAEGDDVYNEYNYGQEEDWNAPFVYNNIEVLPSCQTGEVELLVQIKDGVKELSLILERSEDEADSQIWEIEL